MKRKLVITIVAAFFIIGSTTSQVVQKTVPVAKPATVIKAIPVPPPPPPPPASTNKTAAAGTQSAPVYSLTSVRVSIRTGADNKEFPSKVLVLLKTRTASIADWSPFYQLNLDNEMRINSTTEFGLERDAQKRGEAKLDAFQSSGLMLNIEYLPNFIADAWKIENVSIVLEFKDQNGNLHPTLGHKTITFTNAYGFLNNDFRHIECVTDGSFAPLTAVIKN